MRTASLVAGGLLIAAAGFAAGYLFAGSPARPTAARVDLPSPAPSAEPASASASAPAAVPGEPAPERTPLPADGDFEAWLRSQPAPEGIGGPATLHVSVRSADGAPMAGVEVVVEPAGPGPARDPQRDGPEPLGSKLRRSIDRVRWEGAARRTAATDASGRCSFTGLPDTSFQVTPRRTGWRFRRDGPGAPRAAPGESLAFVGLETVITRVVVIGPDGAPPATAWVRFPREGTTVAETWTPAGPEIDLPPGEYEVVAGTGSWGLIQSDPVLVKVGPGAPAEPPVLRLRARPSLRGRLALADGLATERARVYLLRTPAAGAPSHAQIRADGQSWSTGSHNGHEFVFRDLAPGSHVFAVSLSPEGEPLHHVEEIEIPDGPLERDVAVPMPERSRILVVRLLDPAGTPVRDATVSAQYREGDFMVAFAGRAGLRSDGAWVLAHFDARTKGGGTAAASPFDAGAGRFVVTAHSARWGAIRGECPASAEPAVEIRFASPGSLAVAIDGYLGSPYHGRLRAVLEPLRGAVGGGGSTWALPPPLDREGRAVFAAVQPGAYELVLSLGRTGKSNWTVSRTPVTVEAGSAEAKVALPPLHPVRIHARDWVNLRRRDDASWFCQTDRPGADGVIVLDGLPAGDYTVQRSGGSAEVAFSVPGAAEVVVKE